MSDAARQLVARDLHSVGLLFLCLWKFFACTLLLSNQRRFNWRVAINKGRLQLRKKGKFT